jgi:purine-binding chemotaxis protein CheW
MRHVVFRLEKERYALPLAAVREVVVPPRGYSLVPRAPRAVRGVMNLRGRVVTVVELAPLMGLGDPTGAGEKIILLDRGRRDLGLLVAEVDGIELIEKVVVPPGSAQSAVRGLARLKGLAVTVLDPDGVDGLVGALFGAKSAREGA